MVILLDGVMVAHYIPAHSAWLVVGFNSLDVTVKHLGRKWLEAHDLGYGEPYCVMSYE